MAKRTVTIEVIYEYRIEVDEESELVKDYDTMLDLYNDLVHYRFKSLPVLENGVNIINVFPKFCKIIPNKEKA